MEKSKEKVVDQVSCRCCNEIPDTRNITETKDQLKFHNPQFGQTTDELNEVESSEYATNDQFRTRPEYFNPKTCKTTTEKDEL
ncbi:MAG: hypothetical protein WAV55_12065 [Clostridiaceae bacterium]